jgi:hypothetical protein
MMGRCFDKIEAVQSRRAPFSAVSDNPIILKCNGCGRSIRYPRETDLSIPLNVVTILQPHCDRCWHGEPEGEMWFDANGCIVSQ